MKRQNQKGFTLIELMIVVAIIGILATLGVPQFQRFQARARQAEARTTLSGIYMAMKSFHAEWNRYYGNLEAIGYAVDGRILYDGGFSNSGEGPPEHPVQAYQQATSQTSRLRPICTQAGATCQMITPANNVTCDAAGNVETANGRFRAEASGMVNPKENAVCDVWTITENKMVENTQPGI